ncbi:MAG: capsular biosynthesis protein [Rhodobacteraceae bacterium]|nr:capsular biosynthesis protein [Paracoccaceae bacterium]MAY47697.1 capsular biosynthesis protein [Paracoccaceae bacterium]
MIVLPMAGLSRRFLAAGYEQPKYMLDLHGRPVFDHALGSFRGLFDTETFLVICRDIQDTPAFVRARAAALGLAPDRLHLVVLDAPTAGQAETVALGLRRAKVPDDTPLTIFNIDTFRPGFAPPTGFDPASVDGYLEVFEAPGDHWSFARPHPGTDRVAEVAEKVRISDLCSDGLYHFRSAAGFLSLFAQVEPRDPATLQGGEYYVAPLYALALAQGADIRLAHVPPGALRLCGTPEDYTALRARPPFTVDP